MPASTTPAPQIRSRKTRPVRVPARADGVAARLRRSRDGATPCAPTSVLDEAHRRMKINMLALAGRLRLDPAGVERDATEIVLTDMETRLQSMAQLHRSLCRRGDFRQIDLAVFLREASRLRNSPSRSPLPGGWAVEADGSLIRFPEEEGSAHEPSDLNTALESIDPATRDLARRAVFASAILFPPWVFGWAAPQSGTSRTGHLAEPGRVGFRLKATSEGVVVELSISDRGAGLPERFESPLQRGLALELGSVLARLVNGSLNSAVNGAMNDDAVFQVTFVPSHREMPWLSFARETKGVVAA